LPIVVDASFEARLRFRRHELPGGAFERENAAIVKRTHAMTEWRFTAAGQLYA
jgi:hypothetical protein